jgi:hypothetical protein
MFFKSFNMLKNINWDIKKMINDFCPVIWIAKYHLCNDEEIIIKSSKYMFVCFYLAQVQNIFKLSY